MIGPTYLQLDLAQYLEPVAAFFAGAGAVLLEFFNVSLGIVVYLFVYLPLSILVKYFYRILLETVTIAPVPQNEEGELAIFGVANPSSEDAAEAQMLFESAQIATNYMEPIGFLVIFVGIGFVLFFRVFDVVLNTDFNAEKAQKRLLIAPVLILLWIPLANIVLALASGMTSIFESISVSADIASDPDASATSLDFEGIVESYDPGSGFDAFTESELIPLIIGSLFIFNSFLIFLVAVLAAYIRLFALYLLYAVGPFAIAMWAFAWKKISDLGAAYIRYFILLALFPIPAALVSQVAPIFVLTLETVVSGTVDPDSATSAAETAAASDGTGLSADLSESIGIEKVVRAFGLLLIPLAVGFGPWVFVIGLGNAMTLAAGTAALSGAVMTGGAGLAASKGLSGAKGAAEKGVKKTAKEKYKNVREEGIASTTAKKAASAGGTVRDFGGVAYDHRDEIAESVANSKMISSTGALGSAVQGAAGTYKSQYDMKSKAKEKGKKTKSEAKDRKDKRTSGLQSDFRSNNDMDSELFDNDEMMGESPIGEEAAALEASYAADNFDEETLKKYMAEEEGYADDDWQEISDETFKQNKERAFDGFTSTVQERAENRGESAEEYMRMKHGDRVADSYKESLNSDYDELREYAVHERKVDPSEFQQGGAYDDMREEYAKNGNRGFYASEAQRQGLASFGANDEAINRVENKVADFVDSNTDDDFDPDKQNSKEIAKQYAKSGENEDDLKTALKNGEISSLGSMDEEKAKNIAEAVGENYGDLDWSDRSDYASYANGNTGEIQTDNREEINRKRTDNAVQSDGINPNVDESVQDDIERKFEETMSDSGQEAMESSLEAVTVEDIEEGNADFEFDKLVNEFLGDINGVDSVSKLDSTTQQDAEDFVEERIKTVSDEIVSQNIPEARQMVNETADDLRTGEMEKAIKDNLKNVTQRAIEDNDVDFSNMEIESREELLDVHASQQIVNNIEQAGEDMAHELQNEIMDRTGKAMEDISTGDISTQDVVEIANENEDMRQAVRNARDDI